MSRVIRHILFIWIGLLSMALSDVLFDQWHSKSGSEIEAKLVDVDLKEVSLKTKDGRMIKVPIKNLDEVSQKRAKAKFRESNPIVIGRTLEISVFGWGEESFCELGSLGGWSVDFKNLTGQGDIFGGGLIPLKKASLAGMNETSSLKFVVFEVPASDLGSIEARKEVLAWLFNCGKVCKENNFTPLLVDPYYEKGGNHYDVNGDPTPTARIEKWQKRLWEDLDGWKILPLRQVMKSAKKEAGAKWKQSLLTESGLSAAMIYSTITDEAAPLNQLKSLQDQSNEADPFGGGSGFLEGLDTKELHRISEMILQIVRATEESD